ncbi:hypothetical protein VP01_166g10 [Puccinia sorghi]|uniref:FAD/NAD(P)-binding domain-containing protein n=1 Tax=Puccinia sorghi TaxID=27349 RepID=A0A0L6VG69_9BASI|nr:hypothetical protein VP01_166g10 [Puccinia sorghi]
MSAVQSWGWKGNQIPPGAFSTKMSTTSETSARPHGAAQQACQFLVVGAGPAGLTAVATLLDHGVSHIVWVDPTFSAGRIGHKYRDIPRSFLVLPLSSLSLSHPHTHTQTTLSLLISRKTLTPCRSRCLYSNTKIGLFLQYVAASPTLSKLVNENPERENAYTALGRLDLDQGNLLGYAADLMLMLTDRMVVTHCDTIKTFHARVTALDGCCTDDGAGWTASIEMTNPEQAAVTRTLVKAEKVILATGSEPVEPADRGGTIELEVALSGRRLGAALAEMGLSGGAEKIGVVGSSHSAFLVLRNLATLADGPRVNMVHAFRTGELRFAEQKDGWVLFDNTGLKGLVADWVREEYWPLVEQRRVVRVHVTDPTSLKEALQDCVRVIYAIGYRASATPNITLDGHQQRLLFDHHSGCFQGLKGLFGCGIAFPNRSVDHLGNVELAVGILKFSKFLNSAVPAWIQA